MASVTQTMTITGKESRPEIRTALPGKRTQAIVDQDHEFMATTTKTNPIAARLARGVVVLTEDDNVFLDFTSGVGVVNTGHCHPTIVKAVQEQAARLMHFAGTDYYYDVQASLARELSKIVPGAFAKKTFYTNSGTESTEAALKVVRWATRRPQMLAFTHAFHGRTMGSLSLTSSKTVQRERFFPTVGGVHTVPFPNSYRNPFGINGYDDPERLTSTVLGLVEDLLDGPLPPSEAGAFFVEPVQGEGGYVVPPKNFYRELKQLLDKHGILFVADEVQTGFGRTGKMFAMEHFGVTPQIVTMAKGMGSGLPIGACVFDAKLDFGVNGAHSNTYGGNPVACASSLATIGVIREERLLENAVRRGEELEKRLRELQQKHAQIGDVRGLGLMLAIEIVKPGKERTPDKATRDQILEAAYQRGIMLLPCGKSSIRFIPPLTVSKEQIAGAMDVFGEAVKAGSKAK
jgi:4-aminobutyrate aminotransferase